ncbi:uncharacterized protein LOC129218971 [Uloborus diversus]|uniref:uncharacterized protein LOC129218971 n=1 Tax=Uloborus diversus TaxID=327109 RepID=UPI0024098050|nr:uncharacterized protein LOC129218971 [Uloborus diversus]
MTYSSDIGLYMEKQINDNTRKELLLSPWKPDLSFKFPSSGPRNLRFVLKWLGERDWLVYSPSEDGAFCKFCFLFSTTVGKQRSCPGKLVRQPFRNWKDAKEVFREHEKAKYHSDCLQRAGEFLATYTEKVPSIEKALDVALFLARRGLAFRGHRDSGACLENEKSKEEGNFKALLRFRVESGDTLLKNHLETAGANATYTSWQIQNEIIASFNNIIIRKIIEQVKKAQWFSILVDETTDVSTIKQMTFCVRFIEEGKVQEEFLQFIPITDATGKGLAETIIKTINDLNLQPQCIVGQGYDGARAMSGDIKGVQALIQETYPRALSNSIWVVVNLFAFDRKQWNQFANEQS